MPNSAAVIAYGTRVRDSRRNVPWVYRTQRLGTVRTTAKHTRKRKPGENMIEECNQSEEYANIANEVIRNTPSLMWILEEDISIGYLTSNFPKKSKGKLVCGTCRKIPDRDRWAIPYDFVITVYEPNVEGWSEEKKRILIHHELLHVGMGKGKAEYKVVHHDIEDFREIIDLYGMDWS